jgi:hypothetical protein
LGCFKQSCNKWNIEYKEATQGQEFRGLPVQAVLKDKQGGSSGYLVREGGVFKMMVDSDSHYSSITARCGTKITQDYAVNVVRKGAMNSGGIINGVTEENDGWVTMKIAATG